MDSGEKVRAMNMYVEGMSNGLVTLDGVAVGITQAILADGPSLYEKAQTGGYIELIHQVVHNFIDDDAPPNALKTFDRMLPAWLPLDGIIAGTAAYYMNGMNGLAAFSAVHGVLHPAIVQTKQ